MELETIVISDSDEENPEEWSPLQRQVAVPVKSSPQLLSNQNRSPFTIFLSDDDTPRKRHLSDVIEISDEDSPYQKLRQLTIKSPRFTGRSLFPVKSGKVDNDFIPCKKKKVEFTLPEVTMPSFPHTDKESHVVFSNPTDTMNKLKDLWNITFKSPQKSKLRSSSELPDLDGDAVGNTLDTNRTVQCIASNSFEVTLPNNKRQRSFMDVFKMPLLSAPSVPSNDTSSQLPDLCLSSPSHEIVKQITQLQNIRVVSDHHLLSPLVHMRISSERNFNTVDFSIHQNHIINGWIEEGGEFLNIALEEISGQTTPFFRPPPDLIVQLFQWLFSAPNETQLFQCYKILYQIHTLHDFPPNLDLWGFFQKAGKIIESIATEECKLKLTICNYLLQLLCHFLERNLLGQQLNKEQFTLNRTQAYKLLCSDVSCEKLKEILGWIGIIIKYYFSSKNTTALTILESLQKVLSFACLASRVPKELCLKLLRELCKVFWNLQSLEERQLLLQTMKSDLITICLIEKLFEQIADLPPSVPIEVKLESKFPMKLRKIVLHYFQLQPICAENKKQLDEANSVKEFFFLMSKLLSSYLLATKSQQNLPLHRRQSNCPVALPEEDKEFVKVLFSKVCELEKRFKAQYSSSVISLISGHINEMKLIAFLEEDYG